MDTFDLFLFARYSGWHTTVRRSAVPLRIGTTAVRVLFCRVLVLFPNWDSFLFACFSLFCDHGQDFKEMG